MVRGYRHVVFKFEDEDEQVSRRLPSKSNKSMVFISQDRLVSEQPVTLSVPPGPGLPTCRDCFQFQCVSASFLQPVSISSRRIVRPPIRPPPLQRPLKSFLGSTNERLVVLMQCQYTSVPVHNVLCSLNSVSLISQHGQQVMPCQHLLSMSLSANKQKKTANKRGNAGPDESSQPAAPI